MFIAEENMEQVFLRAWMPLRLCSCPVSHQSPLTHPPEVETCAGVGESRHSPVSNIKHRTAFLPAYFHNGGLIWVLFYHPDNVFSQSLKFSPFFVRSLKLPRGLDAGWCGKEGTGRQTCPHVLHFPWALGKFINFTNSAISRKQNNAAKCHRTTEMPKI